MRVGIITQARMGSSRLPGKIMKPAKGKPLLVHHLDRLMQTGLPVVVATTSESKDDAIVDLCISKGIQYHRGSEFDVLARFVGAAAANDFNTIIRVTSDCPLIDPILILDGLAEYARVGNPRAYLSNGVIRTYARGFDFEIFSNALLNEANSACKTASGREHVTPYFYNGSSNGVTVIHKTQPSNHSFLRVTVDEETDYELIRTLIEGYDADLLNHSAIEKILVAHPELQAINQTVIQKKI